jgi:peptidoglycan hydrolase-like protein with peptidoglycan-binding domain
VRSWTVMRGKAATLIAFALCALAPAGVAAPSGNPEIAALQVGLKARGLYPGTVDGVLGPGTERAVMKLQRRAGLPPNGVPGPSTRRALGGYGKRAPLGGRELIFGQRGWDVAALQFALAWHGFPSGRFDGNLGERTDAALRRFQRWAGITPDGRAGPATFAALRGPLPRSPIRLSWPLSAPIGDRFGPRDSRFHAGIDVIADAGTPIGSAGPGRVVFTGYRDGWGTVVVVDHGHGVRTRYAHLSRITVRVGASVAAGSRVGLVGATGEATGPHLHFEVLVRGANVDPLSALYPRTMPTPTP